MLLIVWELPALLASVFADDAPPAPPVAVEFDVPPVEVEPETDFDGVMLVEVTVGLDVELAAFTAVALELEFDDDGVIVVTTGLELDTDPDWDAALEPDTDEDGVLVVTTGLDVDSAPAPEFDPDVEVETCANTVELSMSVLSATPAHSVFMIIHPFLCLTADHGEKPSPLPMA